MKSIRTIAAIAASTAGMCKPRPSASAGSTAGANSMGASAA